MKFSIKNQVALGFAASLAALLCLGCISYRTITELIQTQDMVAHTHEVIATLESGLATMTDAETAQRGYLLTGDEQFANDSVKAQRLIEGWKNRLRRLVADNPTQQQRLAELEPLITRRLELLNDRIQLRREQGLETVMKLVSTREGKKLMDQIVQKIGDMRDAENELLKSREQAARNISRQSIAIIFVGGLFACVAGGFAFWMIRQNLKAREMAEDELQKSRSQLQSILDNAPAVVFIKDRKGKYLFVNRLFTQVTGKTREEIEGRTVEELFPRETAAAAREHERKILETGNPQQFEEVVNYPDGPHTHLAVKFPLRDASGKIYATSGISADISVRKRAEQERDRFFTLTRDLLCIAGFDGYFKRTNPAWETTFGYSNEEMVSQPFIDFVHPDDRERTVAEGAKLAAGDETVSFENRYRCKDGSYRWLLWNARPIVEQKLIYCSARDVTERKMNEEEIQKLNFGIQQRAAQLEIANKELEAFSYSVSHDLRAPLRHIDGFVGLLDKQARVKLDDNGKRYLEVIAKAARQMGMLIDDLLVFSRMGRAELSQQKVDMNNLVEEVVNTQKAELNGRHVEWKIASLPTVQADPSMLRQVLVNLVSNAVKYSRPRDPAVIEIGCQSETPLEFLFYVRDNGVGFDMQYANKLFGVFQRLHHADEFEGTGIGLANVRRIIHRHGGRTWAEGQVDQGATFFYTLPKQSSAMSPAQ